MRNHLKVIFDVDTKRLHQVATESRINRLAIQSGKQKVAIPENVPLSHTTAV